LPLAGYLVGSIPFGILLTRLFGGGDIRVAGSGNIGATNVTRVVGPIPGVLTLILDGLKGAAAVWLAAHFTNYSATWMTATGVAALVGHCFPVWLKFRGGKGVATAAGMFLALCWPAALGAIGIFLLVVIFSRYVSLGSVAAAASMPLLIYLLWAPHLAPPPSVTIGAFAAAMLVVYKHDGNIQRLVEGREPKFAFSKESKDRDAE
ncbi:MAG TPA: glycerol-3-phosphate 1-O-acyltransferase PlsY, partial [Candidatus Acidoferrum sp.]|nr:glycerol-3-phosphate 1-O-acyltransferase PlsY [Candidatus Acidoferrum sp.]